MKAVSEEEYAKIVDSSTPPPRRGPLPNTPLRNREFFSKPSTRKQIWEEWEKTLEAQGMIRCEISPGVKKIYFKVDCVVHPSGWVQPKIEYLMDKLGPDEVTRRLREAGIHWKKGFDGTHYRKIIHEMTLEAAGKKK